MGNAITFGVNNDQNIIAMVEYDKGGRVAAQRDPRGKRTTYSYDQLNRRTSLSDPLSHVWSSAYVRLGSGGSRVTATDPLGNVTQQDSDRAGRLTTLSYLNESPKQTPDVTFAYDKGGRRTRMTEVNGSVTVRDTRYGYDQAGRLQQAAFDTNGDGVIDQTVGYQYEAGGLRTAMTLPGSKTVSYQYDARRQLVSLTDWASQVTTHQYDSLGRLVALNRSMGLRSLYQYDASGRLRTLRHTANGQTLGYHAYSVDGRGNRTQAFEVLSRAVAGTTTLAYNDPAVGYYAGSWTAVSPYQTTTDVSAALQIACLGTTLMLTMGQGPDHGLYDIYVDGTLWQSIDGYAVTAGDNVLSIPVTADGPHVMEVRSRPEKNRASTGRTVRFKSLVVTGQLYDAQTVQYQYDAVSRLLQARYGAAGSVAGAQAREYDYEYDVAGNRTQQVAWLNGTATTTNYTYDDANRLMSDGTHTYGYDAAGRLTSDGVNTYSWDRTNRLLSMGSTSYQYNGQGQRTQQTAGSTVTQYLLDVQPGLAKVLQATTGGNVTGYVHGLMGIQAQQNPDTTWTYPIQDGLGSVRGTLNSANVPLETRFYDPYGSETQQSGTSQTVFGFTGEETDSNGLVNLRARYYNPGLGQFFSLDPLETLNRYAYVRGNPVNRVDPSGLIGEQPPSCSSGQKCCGPDVTDWFLDELHIHANWVDQNIGQPYAAAISFQTLSAECAFSGDPSCISNTMNGQLAYWSLKFANYAQAIPHKWMNFGSGGVGCPSTNCYRSVTLCNKCIDRAKMGDMLFGVAGIRAGFDAFTIWVGGYDVAKGLQDHDAQSTAGIGINIGPDALRISNTSDLCNRIQSSRGTWSGPTVPTNVAPWEWQYANDSSTDHSTPTCTPCTNKLPTSYPHTTPTFAGSPAGFSIYADKRFTQNKFFTDQIPGLQYLDPCLCKGISDPNDRQLCIQLTQGGLGAPSEATCNLDEYPM